MKTKSKNTWITIIAFVLIILILIGISASFKRVDELLTDAEKHTHEYTSTVSTVATCTTEGVLTYKCSCGHCYSVAIPVDLTNHTAKTRAFFTNAHADNANTHGWLCEDCMTVYEYEAHVFENGMCNLCGHLQ